MTDLHLSPVNRRLRASVVATLLLAFVVVALLTASPPDDRFAAADLGALDEVARQPDPLELNGDSTGLPASVPGAAGAPDADGSVGPRPSDYFPTGSGASSTAPAAPLPGGRSDGGTSGGASDRPLTASDQGVTAETITVGVLDVPGPLYAALGIEDPHVAEVYRALADEVNEQGGINGRRLVVNHYVAAGNPTAATTWRAACQDAIVEGELFMMLGIASWPGTSRCAAELGRPISDPGYGPFQAATAEELQNRGSLYWIHGPSADRHGRDWVDMVADVHGTDIQVGVLIHHDVDFKRIADHVVAELVARGFPEPSVTQHADDEAVSAIQAQNVAAQWKGDVALVMPLTNATNLATWQQAFENNGFRPQWTFSSLGYLSNPAAVPFFHPGQMDGAVGISWQAAFTDPISKDCNEIVARRAPDAPIGPFTNVMCQNVFENVAALRDAGVDLTAASYVNARTRLDRYEGALTLLTSFGPTKFDGADRYRLLEYRANGARGGDFAVVGDWR